jgi:hypothetical protein
VTLYSEMTIEGNRLECIVPPPTTVTPFVEVCVNKMLCLVAKFQSMKVVVLLVSASVITIVLGNDKRGEIVDSLGYPL